MGRRRLCKPNTDSVSKNGLCFYANAGWDTHGNFTVYSRFLGKRIEAKILQPVKITPGVPQILEVFVKLNKPKRLDGCVVLKHFNYAMVNGTKVEVNELAGGAFKNKTLHKPMAMHDNKNNLDRHMVKMGQRSSTVVDDMSINMRSHTKFMIQGAYMIVERFDRRESSFVNTE